jgi:hypothetical protein
MKYTLSWHRGSNSDAAAFSEFEATGDDEATAVYLRYPRYLRAELFRNGRLVRSFPAIGLGASNISRSLVLCNCLG